MNNGLEKGQMMSDLKAKIINSIIEIEGGYVDDPNDSGGETNFGITYEVARDNGYHGDMINMPVSVAFNIYSKKYWDKVCGDLLVDLSEAIAEEVVDTGVNMGTGRAGEFLQRSLNVLNHKQKLYNDLVIDNDIGPATIDALKSYLSKRDEGVLVKMLNCLQGAKYVRLCERREKDEDFVYGWFKNRIEI